MATLKEKKELVKELQDFDNGLHLILAAVSNFGDEKIFLLINDIFNGGIGDRSALTKYQELFTYSLEDEISQFSGFVEEYAIAYDVTVPYNGYELTKEYDKSGENIRCLLKGFKLSKESLDKIVKICDKNKELKDSLVQFMHPTDNYNPFNMYGFEVFEEKHKEWVHAFENELKKNIGTKKFEEILETI